MRKIDDKLLAMIHVSEMNAIIRKPQLSCTHRHPIGLQSIEQLALDGR